MIKLTLIAWKELKLKSKIYAARSKIKTHLRLIGRMIGFKRHESGRSSIRDMKGYTQEKPGRRKMSLTYEIKRALRATASSQNTTHVVWGGIGCR